MYKTKYTRENTQDRKNKTEYKRQNIQDKIYKKI